MHRAVEHLSPHEAQRPEWLRSRPWAPWAAVLAVCFGAFMGQLDASIVTLTYSALGTQFNAPLGRVQWVSLSYLLVLASLLVPVGRLSDAHGRKRTYLWGFVVFTAASAACALSPNLWALVGLRALQAVGAAMLQANSIALVALSVPATNRRAALGVQAAAQALGLALGPAVGGVLVQHLGWRSVFWINVPVGIVAIIAGRLMLPRSRNLDREPGRDAAGLVLLATTASASLLALSGVSGAGLPGGVVAAFAATAVAGGAALVWVERRIETPLLDPRVLEVPEVRIGLARALGGYLVLFAPLVLFSTVFAVWHVGTARGGLILTSLPAGFAGAALLGNALPRRLSNEQRFFAGTLLTTLALGALSLLWRSAPTSGVALGVVGAGLGLALPANNTAIMSSVPRAVAALTGGQVNVARALGTSLGVGLTTFELHVASRLGRSGPTLVLATLAAIGGLSVLSTIGLRRLPAAGAVDSAIEL